MKPATNATDAGQLVGPGGTSDFSAGELLSKSYGTAGGLPVIAIGPKGGKIVGYVGGNHKKPIYAGTPAAKKLAKGQGLKKKGDHGTFGVAEFIDSLAAFGEVSHDAGWVEVIAAHEVDLHLALESYSFDGEPISEVTQAFIVDKDDGKHSLRIKIPPKVKIGPPGHKSSAGHDYKAISSGDPKDNPDWWPADHPNVGATWVVTHEGVPYLVHAVVGGEKQKPAYEITVPAGHKVAVFSGGVKGDPIAGWLGHDDHAVTLFYDSPTNFITGIRGPDENGLARSIKSGPTALGIKPQSKGGKVPLPPEAFAAAKPGTPHKAKHLTVYQPSAEAAIFEPVSAATGSVPAPPAASEIQSTGEMTPPPVSFEHLNEILAMISKENAFPPGVPYAERLKAHKWLTENGLIVKKSTKKPDLSVSGMPHLTGLGSAAHGILHLRAAIAAGDAKYGAALAAIEKANPGLAAALPQAPSGDNFETMPEADAPPAPAPSLADNPTGDDLAAAIKAAPIGTKVKLGSVVYEKLDSVGWFAPSGKSKTTSELAEAWAFNKEVGGTAKVVSEPEQAPAPEPEPDYLTLADNPAASKLDPDVAAYVVKNQPDGAIFEWEAEGGGVERWVAADGLWTPIATTTTKKINGLTGMKAMIGKAGGPVYLIKPDAPAPPEPEPPVMTDDDYSHWSSVYAAGGPDKAAKMEQIAAFMAASPPGSTLTIGGKTVEKLKTGYWKSTVGSVFYGNDEVAEAWAAEGGTTSGTPPPPWSATFDFSLPKTFSDAEAWVAGAPLGTRIYDTDGDFVEKTAAGWRLGSGEQITKIEAAGWAIAAPGYTHATPPGADPVLADKAKAVADVEKYPEVEKLLADTEPGAAFYIPPASAGPSGATKFYEHPDGYVVTGAPDGPPATEDDIQALIAASFDTTEGEVDEEAAAEEKAFEKLNTAPDGSTVEVYGVVALTKKGWAWVSPDGSAPPILDYFAKKLVTGEAEIKPPAASAPASSFDPASFSGVVPAEVMAAGAGAVAAYLDTLPEGTAAVFLDEGDEDDAIVKNEGGTWGVDSLSTEIAEEILDPGSPPHALKLPLADGHADPADVDFTSLPEGAVISWTDGSGTLNAWAYKNEDWHLIAGASAASVKSPSSMRLTAIKSAIYGVKISGPGGTQDLAAWAATKPNSDKQADFESWLAAAPEGAQLLWPGFKYDGSDLIYFKKDGAWVFENSDAASGVSEAYPNAIAASLAMGENIGPLAEPAGSKDEPLLVTSDPDKPEPSTWPAWAPEAGTTLSLNGHDGAAYHAIVTKGLDGVPEFHVAKGTGAPHVFTDPAHAYYFIYHDDDGQAVPPVNAGSLLLLAAGAEPAAISAYEKAFHAPADPAPVPAFTVSPPPPGWPAKAKPPGFITEVVTPLKKSKHAPDNVGKSFQVRVEADGNVPKYVVFCPDGATMYHTSGENEIIPPGGTATFSSFNMVARAITNTTHSAPKLFKLTPQYGATGSSSEPHPDSPWVAPPEPPEPAAEPEAHDHAALHDALFGADPEPEEPELEVDFDDPVMVGHAFKGADIEAAEKMVSGAPIGSYFYVKNPQAGEFYVKKTANGVYETPDGEAFDDWHVGYGLTTGEALYVGTDSPPEIGEPEAPKHPPIVEALLGAFAADGSYDPNGYPAGTKLVGNAGVTATSTSSGAVFDGGGAPVPAWQIVVPKLDDDKPIGSDGFGEAVSALASISGHNARRALIRYLKEAKLGQFVKVGKHYYRKDGKDSWRRLTKKGVPAKNMLPKSSGALSVLDLSVPGFYPPDALHAPAKPPPSIAAPPKWKYKQPPPPKVEPPKMITGPDGKEYPEGTTFTEEVISTTAGDLFLGELIEKFGIGTLGKNPKLPKVTSIPVSAKKLPDTKEASGEILGEILKKHGITSATKNVVAYQGATNAFLNVPTEQLEKVIKTETKLVPHIPVTVSAGSNTHLIDDVGEMLKSHTRFLSVDWQSSAVRDHVVDVHRTSSDGGKTWNNEARFKITGSARKAFDKLFAAGKQSTWEFRRSTPAMNGIKWGGVVAPEAPGVGCREITFPNGIRALYVPYKPTSGNDFTFMDGVRIIAPEGMKHSEAVSYVMNAAGVDATGAEEGSAEKLAKIKLLHVLKPKVHDKLLGQHRSTPVSMEQIDAALGDGVKLLDTLELRDHGVHRGLAIRDGAEFEKRGWLGVRHNVYYSDSQSWRIDAMADAIAKDFALTPTEKRVMNGHSSAYKGGSSKSDCASGGAASMFCFPVAGSGMKSLPGSGGKTFEVCFSTDQLERLDWNAYQSDSYGSTNPNDPSPHRYQNYLNRNERYHSPNDTYEITFRGGMSFKDARCILADEGTKEHLVKSLKAKGVHEINGIPLDDFILTDPAKAKQLMKKGWDDVKKARATA